MAGPFALAGLLAWIAAGLGKGGASSLVLWPASLVLLALAMLAARRRALEEDGRSAATLFAARPVVIAAGMAFGALIGVAMVWHHIAPLCLGAAAVVVVALGVFGAHARHEPRSSEP
jgi:hypothetical protein